MPAIITLILSLILAAAATGFFVFLHSRKLMREAKNYERGLKMVPMLIHLPPVSDDVESNNRDSRDVIDENISKAQVLYNIIASTSQKGFKSNFYGQRHIGFEIVATNGFVYFYASVPVALVAVVEQAIVSAYPAARLEEVVEHNVFNEVGKLSGTIGGELVLKEHFSRPIATYQDIKRDPMQSLLSALATLDKEDGAGVQILLRPAPKSWVKTALSEASKKRKGEKDSPMSKLAFSWVKQLPGALLKPPEDSKNGGGDKPKDISGVDQSLIESIEAKTQHPGYEVSIRVVVSSNVAQRAQAVYSNLIASFSLYDAPGKNGFKPVAAKDMESFVTAYILRFFPPEQNKNVLNSMELAGLFHLPDQSNIPTTQVERQSSKQVDGPRNVPDEGLIIGYNVFRGAKKKIVLSDEDRKRHVYVVGQTGVGKSVFLENIALQDMLNGKGFAFVDPHGDSAELLLGMVPQERTKDVIYFCPADLEYPMGLNLFEFDDPDQQDFLIQEGINMLYKLYDPQRQGIIGPRYEYMFRNAAKVVMADPAGGTFIDIPKLFNDKEFLNEKLKHVKDKSVLDFWQKEVPASERSNEFGEVKSWFVSKFSAFLGNDMMRNIIGQTESAFNMRDIMDNGKILLVNLSKGRTGELNAKLLGMIFVMKFQAAAMARSNVDKSQRKDFTLYVDEFQNFATDAFASILSEARKFGLSLIVANQFTTQLTEEIRDAVFGNVGTAISFRMSAQDAENMAKQFYHPIFDVDDLTRLPVGNTAVRMLISGFPTQPFSMNTLPPLDHHYNAELAGLLKQSSASKFGIERSKIEKIIFKRLETPEKPAGAPVGPSAAGARPAQAAPGSGSFMDDWLSKRGSSTQPQSPAPAPGSAFSRPSFGTPQQPPAQARPISSQQQPTPVQASAPTATPQHPNPLQASQAAPSMAPTTALNNPQSPSTSPTGGSQPQNATSATETPKTEEAQIVEEQPPEGHLKHDDIVELR